MTTIQTTKDYMSLKDARLFVKGYTGVEPPAGVIQAGRTQGRIEAISSPDRKSHGKRDFLYKTSDVLKIAEQFRDVKKAHLTLEDAWNTFNSVLIRRPLLPISLEEFQHLITYYNVPPVSKYIWGVSLFALDDVYEAAETLTAEHLQKMLDETPELYSTKEAADYLTKKLGYKVLPNTIIWNARRGKIKPAFKTPGKKQLEYRFSKETLDTITYIRFREDHQVFPEPVEIQSDKDMQRLVKQHGSLVSFHVILDKIEASIGHRLNEATLRAQLRYKVPVVGTSGSQHYYPEKLVDTFINKTYKREGYTYVNKRQKVG